MSKTRKVATVTAVATLAAVAAIGACSSTSTKEASSPAPASTTQTSAAAESAAHNHADVHFAHMMIPHHQQAIEMSDIVLAKQDIDPRVVDLAKQIKAAQGPEIEQLQGWLKQWGMPMSGMPGMGHGGMRGSEPPSTSMMPSESMMPSTSTMPSGSMMPGMGGMSGMEGMMSPAELDALKNAQGVEATKLYLTGMIKHHQGALTMAQEEIKNGESPDAVAMARSILESQQKEIDTMNQILGSL